MSTQAAKKENAMTSKYTLSELIETAREAHPHVDKLVDLRAQAQPRVRSMLDTLQIARKHANLTQKAVAAKLGVSQATISRWETGEEEISLRDFVFFMQACKEKVALVAVPAEARLSEEHMARQVISNLIQQLYPKLDSEDILSSPSGKARAADGMEKIQAKAAAKTAMSSVAGLGVALSYFEREIAESI